MERSVQYIIQVISFSHHDWSKYVLWRTMSYNIERCWQRMFLGKILSDFSVVTILDEGGEGTILLKYACKPFLLDVAYFYTL